MSTVLIKLIKLLNIFFCQSTSLTVVADNLLKALAMSCAAEKSVLGAHNHLGNPSEGYLLLEEGLYGNLVGRIKHGRT